MSKLAPLKKAQLPKPPELKKLIGPSFILLGLGLGSGELILWPYLSSNFGLGIIWASVVGITLQFFLNMEVERYTIVTGESIFVGLTRKFGRIAPVWFIFSTLLPWIWPGIIASSATVFAAAFGMEYSRYFAIALLLLIGIMLSMSHVIYKTQEKVQKLIIMLGVPFIFLIAIFFAKLSDWVTLGEGLVGVGDGFFFLPVGLPVATFLGALAYAGAGGNLNLAQSLFAKEKGYGMGKYAGRITNVFKGKKENVKLEGTTFEVTPASYKRYRLWWERLNIEHGIVFWATGAVTMILLSLLAYTTVFGKSGIEDSISFVILEGAVISERTIPLVGGVFLILVGLMLFATQLGVLGSTSRIMSENLVIYDQKKFKIKDLSKFYFIFLWTQIIAGIVIFMIGFTKPLQLVVTGAVLNAFSMFVYSGLIIWTNKTLLHPKLRPSIVRTVMVLFAFAFYGFFSIYTIYLNIFS